MRNSFVEDKDPAKENQFQDRYVSSDEAVTRDFVDVSVGHLVANWGTPRVLKEYEMHCGDFCFYVGQM